MTNTEYRQLNTENSVDGSVTSVCTSVNYSATDCNIFILHYMPMQT